MDCCICNNPAVFECRCTHCGLCVNCIPKHVAADKSQHELVEISAVNSLGKCDQCKNKFAQVRCLCQDDKKRFCNDCIALHLEINMSHCVEQGSGGIASRETLKGQEKRRKIEYLAYEVRKNVEAIKEFRETVSKAKGELIKTIEKSAAEAKAKAEKVVAELRLMAEEVDIRVGQGDKDDPVVEMLIGQMEDAEKNGKNLELIEAKINTENVVKSIKSSCKANLSIR